MLATDTFLASPKASGGWRGQSVGSEKEIGIMEVQECATLPDVRRWCRWRSLSKPW